MRRFLFGGISVLLLSCIQLHGQDSIPHPKNLGLGAKVLGGGYFFPSAFSGYPGPGAGASLSFFAGRFEIETGFLYYRKYARTLPDNENILGPAHFQSVFHIQDYVNGYILTNIKIAQKKQNVFSGYLGLSFRKNMRWSTDTTMADGSHKITDRTTSNAERTVGISLLGGVRYMYFFTPRICFVGSLDLAGNVYSEYHIPTGDSNITLRRPPEPEYQIGFSAGIQFILAGRGMYW
jgi:hypothetical protein